MGKKITIYLFVGMIMLGILISSCTPEPEVIIADTPELVAVIPTNTAVPPPTQKPTSTVPPEPTIPPTVQPTFSPDTITIASGEPVKIAYLLMDANPMGLDPLRGVEISIADFGAEILGHPVELTGLNSECNEFAAQQGASILMQDKSILGVIGTTCSIPALKASPIISENNRVMISPSNTNPDLTAPDIHSIGYARTAPNDLAQIKGVAQFAYENLGARRMAIVRGETDRYSRLYSTSLCEYFAELGGECVLDNPKYAGSTYVAPIINSLREVEADAVYFFSWDFKETAAFLTAVKDSEELKNTAFILWGEVINNSELLKEAGDDAVNVYVSATSYDIDVGRSQYQTFLSTYREDYGEDPISIYHPYAYDAATLLLIAISEVAVSGDDGSLMVDPLAIRDAIYNKVEFQGLSGYISCSPLGDCLSTASGKVYQFISGDPTTFNPGPADMLSSNPVQVWP